MRLGRAGRQAVAAAIPLPRGLQELELDPAVLPAAVLGLVVGDRFSEPWPTVRVLPRRARHDHAPTPDRVAIRTADDQERVASMSVAGASPATTSSGS